MSMRRHSSYAAFAAHRVSGLCLAVFLPAHLFVLAQLVANPSAVDRFLSWTETPLAKALETVLIALAAIHLAGGIRIVAYEFLSMDDKQNLWISASAGFSLFCAILFFANA